MPHQYRPDTGPIPLISQRNTPAIREREFTTDWISANNHSIVAAGTCQNSNKPAFGHAFTARKGESDPLRTMRLSVLHKGSKDQAQEAICGLWHWTIDEPPRSRFSTKPGKKPKPDCSEGRPALKIDWQGQQGSIQRSRTSGAARRAKRRRSGGIFPPEADTQ